MKSINKRNNVSTPVMENLKKNNPLQYFIVFLPLILICIYIFAFMQDLALVYGNAKVNQDLMKEDKSIVKIIEYSGIDDEKYEIIKIGGIKEEIKTPQIVTVLADKNEKDKGVSYYSKDNNVILHPIEDDFVKNFLTGNSYFTVILSMIPMLTLLGFAVYNKSFTVLSKKRYWAVYMFFTILLLLLCVLVFAIF